LSAGPPPGGPLMAGRPFHTPHHPLGDAGLPRL